MRNLALGLVIWSAVNCVPSTRVFACVWVWVFVLCVWGGCVVFVCVCLCCVREYVRVYVVHVCACVCIYVYLYVHVPVQPPQGSLAPCGVGSGCVRVRACASE